MSTNELSNRTTEAIVAKATELTEGQMKMAKVGERRVVIIRTASGIHALDNACPHQGYGMATGSLDGELLTCQWHNWKFRVTDGVCVMGQENLPCHPVRIEDDDVVVTVTEPTAEEQRRALWPSLQHGIERDYRGQIARDTARLLQAGATPESIVEVGLQHGLPRTEWGLGHDMAVAADLLHLSDRFDGIEKTLPLAQALSGFAESSRDRKIQETPHADDIAANQQVFVEAIESEDGATAVGALRTLLASAALDAVLPQAQSWFIDAVSRHHYDYGHGAIYTQKSFELIARMPESADLILSKLAMTLVFGTREDTLPYMRQAKREIDEVDFAAIAAATDYTQTGWGETAALVELLLDADAAPIHQLADAVLAGAGVPGLLNVVSLAAARRLLRFDLAIERDRHEEFGWLDITHVLTYVNAARWAWRTTPGPEAARLAFFTAFLAFDSGRAERRINRIDPALPEPAGGDIIELVLANDHVGATAAALAGPTTTVADQLEAASLEDTAGSFIVMAHLVKMAVAAREESEATGSALPLAATARFVAAPRSERFVTVSAREAIDFVRTGKPPVR
jgi:nitrite reductase/ring-hydroxylating ferredoxin subunit